MKRHWFIAGVVLFWGVSTAWLIRYEAFPHAFTNTADGYRSLLADGPLVLDNWMKVSFGGTPIGFSHTQVDADETAGVSQYLFVNRTILNLKIMGVSQRVTVHARATLDAMYYLQDFYFYLSAQAYAVRISGRRVRGEEFAVTIRSGDSEEETRIAIPDDAVLYSPMTDLALKELKPGQELRVRTFNPVSLSSDILVVRALRRETIVHRGTETDTTVMATDYQGMEALSWVDRNGQVLRQETPFGWSLEECDAHEAEAAAAGEGVAQDMLAATAVPCEGVLDDPLTRETLRVRLRGGALENAALASHRQEVKPAPGGGYELLLRRDVLPRGAAIGEFPDAYAEFLAPTPFLQAADPDMVSQARKIVGDETNSVRAVVALHDWVHRNVRKEPTASIPSALEVLKVRAGDCNEHTYLFVALARAAGIPAKITVGIVYNEGSFYYHAWPAAYVGRWLELDPTFGQPAVDATHIRLLEGELRDQLKLMGMIGRLRVEVME